MRNKQNRKWHVSYILETGVIWACSTDLVGFLNEETEEDLERIGIATIETEFVHAGMNIRDQKLYHITALEKVGGELRYFTAIIDYSR